MLCITSGPLLQIFIKRMVSAKGLYIHNIKIASTKSTVWCENDFAIFRQLLSKLRPVKPNKTVVS